MKKVIDCKIYSPFSHFKRNGFEFKRLIRPRKYDTVTVSLFDNDKKIKTTFIHNFKDVNYYTNIIYRDRNNLSMKDFLTGKWFGTSGNLFLEATDYVTKTKTPFNVSNFGADYYEIQEKGTGYAMGTSSEWQKLVPKGEGNLIPFSIRRKNLCIDVGITRNVTFLTPPRKLRLQIREGILKNCLYKGKYVLTEADAKQLQAIHPGFCLSLS